MVKVFKYKKSLLTGFDAFDRIADRLLDKITDLHRREHAEGVYSSNTQDTIIRLLLRLAKEDLKEAKAHLINFVFDNSIAATNLWDFINTTAKKAQSDKVRWIDKILINALEAKMRKSTPQSVEEWCANTISDSLFDEEKYRDDQRTDEIRKKQFNHYKQIMTWTQSNQQNYSVRSNPYQNTPTSPSIAQNKQTTQLFNTQKRNPPKKRKASKNKMFEFMNKLTKGEEWKKEYCGFYHYPETTCKKKDNCNRLHSCPICKGNHKISDCKSK